nr:nucleotidyl transferase AbiEii/AbiGii toxin family protein [Paenibacillus soyae]
MLYSQERLLYRLSISPYRDYFILKGGLFLYSVTGFKTRPTRDADFLVKNLSNNENRMIEIFKEICSIEVEDGIQYDIEGIKAETITEDADYHGIRVTITSFLEKSRSQVQLDMGFSDVVVPNPKDFDYPVFIESELPAPNIRVYSLESVVAEKFEAMIKLSVLNSRMKDFFDIYNILTTTTIEGRILSEAIKETFEKRLTDIRRDHELFTDEFVDEQKQTQWLAFLRRTRLPEVEFSYLMSKLKEFLLPVYNSLLDEDEFFGTWNPETQKWS